MEHFLVPQVVLSRVWNQDDVMIWNHIVVVSWSFIINIFSHVLSACFFVFTTSIDQYLLMHCQSWCSLWTVSFMCTGVISSVVWRNHRRLQDIFKGQVQCCIIDLFSAKLPISILEMCEVTSVSHDVASLHPERGSQRCWYADNTGSLVIVHSHKMQNGDA